MTPAMEGAMEKMEGQSNSSTLTSTDAGSIRKLIERLNGIGPRDWQIVGFLKDDSSLMISSSDPGRRVAIICSNTWYVGSQTHIFNPKFSIEVGKKKMDSGVLSSRCYDESLSLTMDDGTRSHRVICEQVCVIFFE
jgi:hypothetical protein